MRPLRLDLSGFAAFRDETTVDFTDADFFALVGPTGAGKSTVLDAICFALYGTVPRWNDRRAIVNALAPSANEARVRLAFESGGARYVATRVVRRDGKGRVATTQAGLEELPPGFDLTKLGTGLDASALGTPLAGTPAEMEEKVVEAIGLPFDQFTSCVILPQGRFAEFLHAKPADRQQILINLLGLSVYEKVRDRATARQQEAEARLRATDHLANSLADATEEALSAAAERLAAMARLAADVELGVPLLVEAQATAASARDALAALDADLAVLSKVGAPAGVAEIAAREAAARDAAHAADHAVRAAEERDEKLRADLAAAGDANALRRLLDLHGERTRLAERASAAQDAVTEATADRDAAAARAAQAVAGVGPARDAVAHAEAEVEVARTVDRAATLRPHLVAGEPCPVCEQVVTTVPAMPDAPRLAGANAELERARTALAAAEKAAAAADRAAHEKELVLATALGTYAQLMSRSTDLDGQLSEAPGVTELRERLGALNALQMQLDEAGAAVREAREANRKASAAAAAAQEKVAAAWRGFDGVRDALARFGPPSAERGDLAGAWTALTSWASQTAAGLASGRGDAVAAASAAATSVTEAAAAIEAIFTAAGLTGPAAGSGAPVAASRRDAAAGGAPVAGGLDGTVPDAAAYARAATVAVEQARAAHARIEERRAEAADLAEQRTAAEHDAHVARALALHLRANNFERWLLAEALDELVDGASAILRELSGGQYELAHQKGEFFVVDHHDAALRRGVRTLSGGETFQASLALALALAERLTGLSHRAASLESIMLDEGFGTLDGATLDTVAATLENLAARGDRMVGVVTHVAALAERIPVRFDVTKDARSARVERSG